MLHIIPVPIGNREDITLRGLRMLRELTVLFCEDTRSTISLFRLYDIDWRNKKLYSITSYTSQRDLLDYVHLMKTQECGLVSEAGTPGLSDPGKELIRLCWESDVQFEVLPGANALVGPVVGSPWNTTKFSFWGFCPHKKGKQTFLKAICTSVYPVYFYESVHRIEKTLKMLKEVGFEGDVLVVKELSKMFEGYFSGSIDYIFDKIADGSLVIKGEFVLGCNPVGKEKK